MSTIRTRRYPGLHYFTAEQKDQFFGREAEKRDLLALVLTEKIVVLFSKSGYGKSSLLRAGLAPELPVGWIPLIVQFGAYQAGRSAERLARTLAQLDAALPDDMPEMDFLDTICPENSLWKHFKKKQSAEKRTFLLIFDQFEEFQTYPVEQREAFKKQLSELLYTRIPQAVRDRADELSEKQQDLLARPIEVKALFAIREDRLGVLDGLADRLPAILHKRYHLQGLDDAQATAAITLPAALPQGERFENPSFSYAPAAVEAIKKGLKKDESDPHIESFLLQICCEAIEQKVVGSQGLKSGVTVTEADLPVFKDLFEQYYRGKIEALPNEAQRAAARRMMEDHLVKTDPASGIAYRINADGRALCALAGVDESLLKQLTDFFLLRSEPNTTGGFSYEVSHDRLVEGILVMKKEWEAEEAKRQLVAEAERIERDKADAERRQKRAFWAAVAAGVLILVAVVASVFAIRKMTQANALLEASKLMATKKLPTNFDALISLDSLNCAGWYIRTMSSEVSKLQNVQELNLSSNSLESLPPEIGNLQNLQYLYLDQNRLKYLPVGFGNLQNLQELSLCTNDLSSLPAEIGNLRNLQSLNLKQNLLNSLPVEIGNLRSLQSLDLDENQLRSLPIEIGNLRNLKSICLNHNQLRNLPIEIGNLQSLQELELFNNKLGAFPIEISNLQKLIKLNLGQNFLSGALSPEIGKFQELQSLYLSKNYLLSLPTEIGNLKKLQKLSLFENKLNNLPIEIGNLQQLQELELDENKISNLPIGFGDLQKLQKLRLGNNQLSYLPIDIGNLQNLQEVDLRGNQLNSLPADFVNLEKLKVLNLGGNKFKSLPTQICKLRNLQSLHLWKNQLSTLPAEIINLKKLQELDLRENQLRSLPIEALKQMKNLERINLKFEGEAKPNPLMKSDIEALRHAMPWCEIIWEEN